MSRKAGIITGIIALAIAVAGIRLLFFKPDPVERNPVKQVRVRQDTADTGFVSYTADPRKHHLAFYWKSDQGRVLGSIGRLKEHAEIKGSRLVFAMNGGMFREDQSPQGLYIEDYRTLAPLNTDTGYGNFYLRPNGVFYLTGDGKAVVCTTPAFRPSPGIRYATQSGPMLLIDGRIHPAFREGSQNKHIRNGVGILPDGRVLFGMSKQPVSFYEFASFFRERGCRNALYLDGFVSRTYLPKAGWEQTDGTFGVMLGVTDP